MRLADDDTLARHGIPAAGDVEDALLAAVRDLIVPGMAHSKLDASALERWAARGAPT